MNPLRSFLLMMLPPLLLLLGAVTPSAAATYTSTQDFDAGQGISWSTLWQQCVPAIPEGFQIEAATIEIRAKVWAWPSAGKIDVLASNTTGFYTTSSYQVCSFTPSTHPNPGSFYTRTCTLKANQLEWLADDKCLHFQMLSIFGGTYYLDYAKLTVTATPKVAAPVFSPLPGIFPTSRQVSVSCPTDGATIRYTTDGSDPTASATIYTGPVLVDQTTTLKAIAFKTGFAASDIAAGLYTIQPPIAPGDVDGDGLVDLKDAILALRITAATGPTAGLPQEADVDGDTIIGIAEAIFILHHSGGLR
jgi:hypothetical protein